MAILSKFRKNTDYTAQKRRLSIKASVNAPALSLPPQGVQSFYSDQTVPSGIYFERVAMRPSFGGATPDGAWFPTNYAFYIENGVQYSFSVRQLNQSTYRLQCQIQNLDVENYRSSSSVYLEAKVSLAVSPFK